MLGKEGDGERVRDERMSRRKLKTRQGRERENTKLLLLLTLKRPVSSTRPLSHPFLLLLLSQPHLFTLTGLERGLASPAVSPLSFYMLLLAMCRFPSLLALKKTQKE